MSGMVFSLDAEHLRRQESWSRKTFGPGPRTQGVLDHIRKEIGEISDAPDDLQEWVDLIILGFDGALRANHAPQFILDVIRAKQTINETRKWPDWRTQPEDKAIEHIK